MLPFGLHAGNFIFNVAMWEVVRPVRNVALWKGVTVLEASSSELVIVICHKIQGVLKGAISGH